MIFVPSRIPFMHFSILSLCSSLPSVFALLTFDSSLPGIKYSWALYIARNAASSSKPSRNFQSFIALARSAKHFRALRFKSESRDERNGVAVELCCFPRKVGTFEFYYVFGGVVFAQLSHNCRQNSCIAFDLASISSDQIISQKICTEIDSFAFAKENEINILNDTTRKLLV